MHDKYYINNEKTWNDIATSFDRTRRKPWNQCIKFIDLFSKNNIIADFGCGNGRHLIPCADKFRKAIGVDISRNLLNIVNRKLIKRNIKNVYLIHSDLTQIPIKSNSLDAVLFIASLHNIKGKEKRIQSLREVKRVLNSKGQALISVWSRWQDKYRKQFFKNFFLFDISAEFGDINIFWCQHGLNVPRFYHLYSKREFIIDLKKAGLEILKIDSVKFNSKEYPDNYFALVK